MASVCPECQATLPASNPGGTCPRCVARVSLLPEVTRANPSSSGPAGLGELEVACGSQLGDFEFLEVLGRGGMGVVYRARQGRLGRVVAIKTIRAEHSFQPEIARRFRREADSLATLRHPNIVGIHEFFEDGGRQFIVMELVEGGTLAALAGRKRFDSRSAAELVRKLAQGVHYAHGREVIHRDLKPSNVLIDERGEPRLTDFGLAKRLNDSPELTLTMHALGTPQFMAPEQTNPALGDVDVRADVYGLGAILYFLLAGRGPCEGDSLPETLWKVGHEPPRSLHLLDPAIPRDLDAICARCLEKEPARRYESAEALAEDLTRFLHAQPTQARPLSSASRLGRWAVRQPAVASLAALSALGIIAFLVSLVSAERRLAHREELLDRRAYAVDMHLALQAIRNRDFGRARRLLGTYDSSPSSVVPSASGESPRVTERTMEDGRKLVGWEWFHMRHLCGSDEAGTLGRVEAGVHRMEFSPDGSLLWVLDGDNRVIAWDMATHTRRMEHRDARDLTVANSLAVSPDGRLIALVGEHIPLRLLNASSLEVVKLSVDEPLYGRGLKFGPDSATLGVLHADSMTWLDLVSRRVTATEPIEGGQVFGASRDLRHFAASWGDGRVELLGRGGSTNRPLVRHNGFVGEIVFSSDGGQVATSSGDKTCQWTDLSPGGPPRVFTAEEIVTCVDLSPDSQLIAYGGADQLVHLHRTTGEPLAVLRGHDAGITRLRFSPDGESLVSGDDSGQLKWWLTHPVPQPRDRLQLPGPARRASVSGDFGAMFTDLRTGGFSFTDLREMSSRTIPLGGDASVRALALDGAGRRLAAENTNGWVALFDLSVERPREIGRLVHTNALVRGLAFSPGDQWLAVDFENAFLEFWELETRQRRGVLRHQLQRTSGQLAFSPDAQLCSLGFPNGQVQVVSLGNGRFAQSWRAHASRILATQFHPSARQLATAAADGYVRVWSLENRKLLADLRASNARVTALAYSPDGNRLFAGTEQGTIRIWDLVDYQELATLTLPDQGYLFALGFAPDGDSLLAFGESVFRLPAPRR